MSTFIYPDNLKSARLYTRKLTIADVPAWAKFFDDKEALEFVLNPGFTTNEERARHWIERQISRYAAGSMGLQALFQATTNEFIGQCGLLVQNVDGINEIEVGYHILKKSWGQGYAPEAAKLFIDFAFQSNLTKSVISIIDVKNIRSQRVAEKNGLALEKQTCCWDKDVYIYRITKQ